MIWLDHGKWQKLKSILFGLFVCIPAAGLVIFLHNLFVDSQLFGHELKVDGVVTELYVRHSKNRQTPYAVFSYPANGKIWTQHIVNKEHALMVGDTLTVVCSELDPEIFVRIN
ncbi:hypothetical protein [Pedobacter gandavensis]|uniref:hypothetical protein n=1 Tax=Pedobacter gandavensis TaxID=2679963 RepID=UPI00292F5DFF|nr:hypothetical protein [Pedobacter gandavensis]